VRRIPGEKAAEIVRLRAGGMPPEEIAGRLGISMSTVYNYLSKHQAFADEAFLEELRAELDAFHKVYQDGNAELISVSGQARGLAQLLRKYLFMPEELTAQALLNAHWRRLDACRRPRRST